MRFVKSFLLLAAVSSFLLSGCGKTEKAADGKLQTAAGLAPVAHLVQAVGKEYVDVAVMLPEGKSPHDYAPGPRDVKNASAAKLFFSCDLPFEHRVVKPLGENTKVVDLTATLHKIPFGGEHKHGPDCVHGHGDHHSDSLDPHVWLDLENLAKMTEIIAAELSTADPAHKEFYLANARKLKEQYLAIDREIAEKLSVHRGKSFFVYHSAFGYYANRYHLKQVAIELGGREIAPARLAKVIRQAKAENAKIIFVQKQFNPASSKALADAVKGKVAGLDPLAADVAENLKQMTAAICSGFEAAEKSK